jgi:hypothetical protein
MVLRGYYDGKAIILDEPADLPRNQPLVIDVKTAPQPENSPEFEFRTFRKKLPGALENAVELNGLNWVPGTANWVARKKCETRTEESFLDWAIRNPIDDPSLPTDLAHQHDHYLYGTPKRKD